MEELFCHKLHGVNRNLFCLPVGVGSALTCYSLLLFSVSLGANMPLSHFCVLFSWEKIISTSFTVIFLGKSYYFIYC